MSYRESLLNYHERLMESNILSYNGRYGEPLFDSQATASEVEEILSDISYLKMSEKDYAELLDDFLPWRYKRATQKSVRYCFVLIKAAGYKKEEAEDHYGDFTHANREEISEMIFKMELDAGMTSTGFLREASELDWTMKHGFHYIGEQIATCFDCRFCETDEKRTKGRCSLKHVAKVIGPKELYPFFKNCFQSRYGHLNT